MQVPVLNIPNFPQKMFWDFEYSLIDWQASYRTIIARILERGSKTDCNELIRFYGTERILNVLKNEIVFLPDYVIDRVSVFFSISKEEMLCWKRKQLRQSNWI